MNMIVKELVTMLLNDYAVLDAAYVCQEMENFFPTDKDFPYVIEIIRGIKEHVIKSSDVLNAIYNRALNNAIAQLEFSSEERMAFFLHSVHFNVRFQEKREVGIIINGKRCDFNRYDDILKCLREWKRKVTPRRPKATRPDALGNYLDKHGNTIAIAKNGKRVRANRKGFEIRVFNIKRYRISVSFLGDKLWPASPERPNYNNHKITVSKDGKHCSFEYWSSIAHPEIKKAEEVFWAVCCFATDAVSGLMDFEEYCNEFGYETDSRTAEISWKISKRAAAKVERCFGDVWRFYRLFNNDETPDEKDEETEK